MILSAALTKSGPLDFPSEKSFLLFFSHEKGLGRMFQEYSSCSPILSFCVATSQNMIFDQTTPVNGDRKCKMSKILSSEQRLQQCSSGNSILLQVTRCIQLVHRQNMETSAEIFYIPA